LSSVYDSKLFQAARWNMDRVSRKKVVCFGSSSGEMLDYIFGESPNYFSLWLSGNTARRLPATFATIDAALGDSAKGAIALCVCGTSDVLIHMQHVACTHGEVNTEEVIEAAVQGLVQFEAFLKEKSFSQVVWLFFSPIIPLPPAYWSQRLDIDEPLPSLLLAKTLREMARRASQTLGHAIDLFDALTISPEAPFLKEAFRREPPDHHPDYIKLQDLIWAAIRDVPGLPRRKKPAYGELYPHIPRDIEDVFKPQNPVIQRLRAAKA